MFLNQKGFSALTQECVDWTDRSNIIRNAIGKPISEENDVVYINGVQFFRLNGKDSALCNVYSKHVCTGCPLRADRVKYVETFKSFITKLDKNIKIGTVTKDTADAIENWRHYLNTVRDKYTSDIDIHFQS